MGSKKIMSLVVAGSITALGAGFVVSSDSVAAAGAVAPKKVSKVAVVKPAAMTPAQRQAKLDSDISAAYGNALTAKNNYDKAVRQKAKAATQRQLRSARDTAYNKYASMMINTNFNNRVLTDLDITALSTYRDTKKAEYSKNRKSSAAKKAYDSAVTWVAKAKNVKSAQEAASKKPTVNAGEPAVGTFIVPKFMPIKTTCVYRKGSQSTEPEYFYEHVVKSVGGVYNNLGSVFDKNEKVNNKDKTWVLTNFNDAKGRWVYSGSGGENMLARIYAPTWIAPYGTSKSSPKITDLSTYRGAYFDVKYQCPKYGSPEGSQVVTTY